MKGSVPKTATAVLLTSALLLSACSHEEAPVEPATKAEPVAADATILSLARQIVSEVRDVIPVVDKSGAVIGGLQRTEALDILFGTSA